MPHWGLVPTPSPFGWNKKRDFRSSKAKLRQDGWDGFVLLHTNKSHETDESHQLSSFRRAYPSSPLCFILLEPSDNGTGSSHKTFNRCEDKPMPRNSSLNQFQLPFSDENNSNGIQSQSKSLTWSWICNIIKSKSIFTSPNHWKYLKTDY